MIRQDQAIIRQDQDTGYPALFLSLEAEGREVRGGPFVKEKGKEGVNSGRRAKI